MASVRKVVISSVVLCMVMFSPYAEAAVTCNEVAKGIEPCAPYLQYKATTAPPPACCSGIKGLNSAASTTPDRQAACNCLKSLAGSMKNIDTSKASGLPGQCGVNVPFPISMNTDCSTIR